MAGKATDTWKQDERDVAERFNKVLNSEERYGHRITRIPLSGSNNRRTDGTPQRGDVCLPDELDAHIELKRRKTAAHQTFVNAARDDAKKHGINPDHSILFFKTLRQRGFTVLLADELFFKLLSLPGAVELLERRMDDKQPPNAPKSGRGSTQTKKRKSSAKDQDQNLG